MIFLLRTPKRRIAFALLLSALAHALLIWLPDLELPRFKPQLPQLTAKLEPLPNIATQPSPKKRKSKPVTLPAPPENISAPLPASSVVLAEPAASAPAETNTLEPLPEAEVPAPPPTFAHPQLPKHAQLRFAVRKGVDGFKVGEVLHQLDIIDGRYTIESSMQTSGLARLFKSYNLNQTSNGSVSAAGLRPDGFSEEKNDSGRTQTVTAIFDWEAHQLHFSEGGESTLTENVQDALSILYQLSQLPLKVEIVPVAISNGKKLENYKLEVASNEMLSTALGELHTVHLRKMRTPDEAGLEIWLSMEYRLLPVKVQYLEPDGSVVASIIITDIRVADE